MALNEEQKANAAKEEEIFDDVPDEFQDPITAEIMEDPVILPSGQVCDRSVIQRHLLTDETDPFSRAKCTVEMLKPHDALKQQIEQWRREKRRASAEPAADGAMDTSA